MITPILSHSHVIGIMSGTSLDGVDLAYCHFKQLDGKWEYDVIKAETIKYPDDLSLKLSQAMKMTALDLAFLDNELGRFIAQSVNIFMGEFKDNVELIASHGHTVFHQPELGLTTQIGNGSVIAALTGKDTVYDFRTMDVALGGQGAPLVPIGDELLFGTYDICLNLGGISNLSYRHKGQRKAFDISPCNIALNHLAQPLGHSYDADGNIAKQGQINHSLLQKLNQLEYYQRQDHKSLGREWIDQHFLPLLVQSGLSIEDQLRTVCEHIAEQIASVCNTTNGHSLLITGGGTHNRFLINLIRQKFHGDVVIPNQATIDFKEAIIFAFLGVLRANGLNNCLTSVTGARHNSCGGTMVLGKQDSSHIINSKI